MRRPPPSETNSQSPIPYPARMAGVPDALIFFCALFLYQDKKRVWGIGGKAPHDNSPRHKPAPIGNHFMNPRRTVASIKNPFGNLFHDHAHVEAFNEALFCDHTLIEVFNGV